MIKFRRAFWLRPRRGRRPPVNLIDWLWQSGGILLLGAVAAGMTAFPSETLTILRPFGDGLALVFGTGLKGLALVRSVGEISFRGLRSSNSMAKDIQKLRLELKELSQRRIFDEEQLRELIRLRDQLRLKQRLDYAVLGARVIGGDPGAVFNSLLLDSGFDQGVRKGQAVICPDGAVGRIMSVGPDSSVLIWLCDPRSRIAAYVQRSRVYGVLAGNGSGCELKYLSLGDDVKVGDAILTAGRGSVFPKGVLIGIVKEIRREGLLLAVDVEPAVKVKSLEEVLIVSSQGPSAP